MAGKQGSTSSRLIARLREISRGASSPLGFVGRAQAKQVPAMLVVASLARNDAAQAEAAIAAGADALIAHLHSSPAAAALPAPAPTPGAAAGDGTEPGEAEAAGAGGTVPPIDVGAERTTAEFGGLAEERERLAAIVRAAGGKPVGVAVGASGEVTAGELGEMAEMGIDFVLIHPHRAPVALLGIEALGHVVRLDRDYPPGQARGLNEVGVDAVALSVGRPAASLKALTVHDIASLRQLSEGIRRPILMPTTLAVQPGELGHIRELGVEALILTPDLLGEEPEQVGARVSEYRQAVDGLGPPVGRARVQEGRRVVLPRPKVSSDEDEEDDEDDDE